MPCIAIRAMRKDIHPDTVNGRDVLTARRWATKPETAGKKPIVYDVGGMVIRMQTAGEVRKRAAAEERTVLFPSPADMTTTPSVD